MTMDLAAFNDSISAGTPPNLSTALTALWHDGRGDWNAAHDVAQNDNGPEASWVHAYLHRKEGDSSNAAYWYRRAGKPVPKGSLTDEWAAIVANLLARSAG